MPIPSNSLPDLQIRGARPDDLSKIETMLATAGLPISDVREHLPGFTLAWSGSSLVGTAAIQRVGDHALLRSVCVSESLRGRGIASALCDHVLKRVRELGVKEAHLLTTTASAFFRNRGFAEHDRSRAPPPIRHTEQFQSCCPATAVYMSIELG
ncbi:MAG TPA: arsenic resistance N-acetyltransferase ArsN2 [Polyangiaceae bacterium]